MNARFSKTLLLRVGILLGSLGALALAANAQSAITKANVPFEFAAGGARLPPGEYSVDVADLSGVLLLHGSGGNAVALLTTLSGAASPITSAKLIFERRDGMAYLSVIEWPNESARVMSPFQHISKGALAVAHR